jgi:hypothetical protein
MTDHDAGRLSEEEAARVWSQAAQLQADASGGEDTPQITGSDDGVPYAGYEVSEVRSAAHEAGIAPEFVEVALADLRVERAFPRAKKGQSLARRFLNDPPDTITVRKVVEATPEEVFSAMQAVFPNEPFRLTLTDQQGDPLNGGLLVFDLPKTKNPFERGFAFETSEGGLRQLFVTLRPVEETRLSCELTVRSPATMHRTGFGLGMLAATLGGGAGLAGFGALGLALGMGPLAGIGGLALGAGLGMKGFRALYAFALRRAGTALERLVGAVATRATGLWRG